MISFPEGKYRAQGGVGFLRGINKRGVRENQNEREATRKKNKIQKYETNNKANGQHTYTYG